MRWWHLKTSIVPHGCWPPLPASSTQTLASCRSSAVYNSWHMSRSSLAVGCLATVALAGSLRAQAIVEPPRLLDDIKFLTEDRLQGRSTGSTGADSAAAYLARRFSEVGLQPAAGGWFQSFTVGRDAPAARQGKAGGVVGKNVIGILPGRDRVLRNQTV